MSLFLNWFDRFLVDFLISNHLSISIFINFGLIWLILNWFSSILKILQINKKFSHVTLQFRLEHWWIVSLRDDLNWSCISNLIEKYNVFFCSNSVIVITLSASSRWPTCVRLQRFTNDHTSLLLYPCLCDLNHLAVSPSNPLLVSSILAKDLDLEIDLTDLQAGVRL